MRHRALIVCCVACLSGVALAAPKVLIDTQFGRETVDAQASAAKRNPRVTGRLPKGWADNSEWANVWADYQDGRDGDRTYTRIAVTRLDDGRCQATCPLPDLPKTAYFRLEVTARTPTGSTVHMGIRQRGTPYKFLWEVRPALSAEWRSQTFDFQMRANRQPIGFWVNLDGVGQVDIAELRLAQLSREDIVAELRAKYPDGGPRNLFRNSRLPLGIQSGWSLGRDSSDGDDVVIGPDGAVAGPSGSPALRIQAAQPMRLTSEPFLVKLACEKHTASLHVRGKLRLKLSVLHNGGGMAGREIDIDSPTGWTRAHVTFQPRLLGGVYALRVEGAGTFWIDGLQAAAGSEPIPYESQMPCEVALALPKSDASPARVQFDDERAAVRFQVTGTRRAATVKLKVVNAYGKAKELSLPSGRGAWLGGTHRYDVAHPRTPYGPFRIEAWAEDARGKRISPLNELIVYRLRRPRYWGKDAPRSPFGVHTNSTTRHNLMAKAVGVNWVRLHDAGLPYIGWYHLERQKGVWTFHDKEIRRYRRDHIKVLPCLSTAPEWASHYPGRAVNGYFDRFYQPKRLADFANYVRVAVARYKDVVDTWDVWNEPWIHAWWGVGHDAEKGGRAGYFTSQHPQADFARLMKTARENARSVDAKAILLGVNSTTGGGGSSSIHGTEWTRGVVEAGGLDHADVVCYHNYASGVLAYPGDAIEKGFATATSPIAEKLGRIDRPVWMTEGSAAREMLGNGMYHHTVQGQTPAACLDSADRLCRYIVSLLGAGCSKVFLYSMHCHGYFGPPGAFGVLVTQEGYLHPMAAGHAALAWELEDTRFVRRIEVAKGVFAYMFEAAGAKRSVAVLAPRPSHGAYVPPSAPDAAVRDVLGNPWPAKQALGQRLVIVSASGSADELAGRLGAPTP